jgi:DNA-directed RNA polymerase subunit RPC12/RpoP
MTAETRTTITLGDIAAVEYECVGCQAKMIRIIEKGHMIPLACGNCGREWFAKDSNEHRDLSRLTEILKDFPKSSVNKQVFIRLEITGTIPATSTHGR